MKTDWVAEVFSAMRDRGEDISIVFGSASTPANDARLHWYELQHDQFDGIGGLAYLLRDQGREVQQLPTLAGDRLSFGRGLRGLLGILPELKSRRRQWLRFDAARRAAFMPVPDRVAWHFLTVDETARIARAAKEQGVSVNTYLLFHLDAVVKERFVPPSAGRRWMVPINLRGAVKRDPERVPHMAFLGVDIDRDAGAAQVQDRIDRLRRQAYHWGVWIMLHAGRLMGKEGMRRDIDKREREEHGWTGIFSNLGDWKVPGAGNWIFCPAISRVYPVGAGCITMNGHMALSVQLHDVLCADLQAAYAVLHAWRQACLPAAGRTGLEHCETALKTA